MNFNAAIEYIACLAAGVTLTLASYRYGSWPLWTVGLILVAWAVVGPNVAEYLARRRGIDDETPTE